MKTSTQWREEFQARYARAVGSLNITGVSFDMNKLIEELTEDIQDDALGLPPKDRPLYGVVTRAEAEATTQKLQ